MRLSGHIKKGWGWENIVISNDKYCLKELHFYTGKKFSLHFHKEKDETWYVQTGKFKLTAFNLQTGTKDKYIMLPDTVWHIRPLLAHQIECIENGYILEVSTPDSVEDNYRIEKGD